MSARSLGRVGWVGWVGWQARASIASTREPRTMMPSTAGSVPSREGRTLDACNRNVPSCFFRERVSTKLCQLEKAEDRVSDTLRTY